MPDLQYQVLNFSSDSLKLGLHRWPGFTFIFSVCRPKSRGEITLRDAAGKMPPRILANYLTDPDDVRIMLAGFRIARQIAATEPFRSLVTEQVRPRSGDRNRRRDRRLRPQHGLDGLSSLRHLPDGRG